MNRSVSVALALLAYASACGSGPAQAPQAPVASAGPSRADPSPPPGPGAGGGTAATPATPPSPAEQEHWRTVQGLAAAVDAHDLERIAAAYTPDAELTVIPGAGVLRGSENIAADQQPFFQAFPDYRYAVERAWVAPDAVIAEQVGFGTNTGDFLGMK
ncbi:MAG TPA: nuclear transport factor 2 family protein, partial [Solirubrobacteraceae bacterium]